MRNHGAVPGRPLLAAVLLAGLLIPTSGAAQSFLTVHGERWTLDSGHLGAVEARGGVGITVGTAGGGRSTGVTASWVPEGDVEPGWIGLQARRGFSGALGPLRLSGEAGLAGLNMRVGNRHRTIEACRAQGGCSFESADYESGWGMGGTIAGTAAVRLSSDIGVVLRHSRMRLLLGANGGETFRSWSLGLTFGLN